MYEKITEKGKMQYCQIKPEAVAWGTDVIVVWVIEDIKNSHPEVKASKSDNWLQSYSHFYHYLRSYNALRWGPCIGANLPKVRSRYTTWTILS